MPEEIRKVNKYNLFESFKYAFSGLVYAFQREPNLSLQLSIGITFFGLAIFRERWASAVSNIILMSLVMSLEMLNTSIENLCDLVHPEYSEKVKIIKDLTAGSVLIAALAWFTFLVYIALVIIKPEFKIEF